MNKYKFFSYRPYLNYLTFEFFYNKVREIEDHDIKYKFIVVCDFFILSLSRERLSL
jgi:hypothetical protein